MKLKKVICFILGLFMAALCGCGGVTETSEESVDKSADGSSQSEESEDSKENEYIASIDLVLCGTSDRGLNSMNLLKALSYDSNLPASSEYPDKNKTLTDGIVPKMFDADGSWVGYNIDSNAASTITFDLGEVKGGLLDFSVAILDYIDYGILAPNSISVSIAGEDENYVEVGTAHRPTGSLTQNQPINYRVLLHNAVEARYIRYEISAKRGWLFLSEITAISYDENYEDINDDVGDLNRYYGYNGIPEITSPEYWNESEKDYKAEKNIVKSKKAYVSAEESIEKAYLTEWYNGTDIEKLTDGKTAKDASYSAAQWFHVTQGYSRTITFDLEKTCGVKGFSIGFLRDSSAGVELPTNISFLVSENGEDWQKLFFKDTISAKANEIIRIDEAFDKSYKARYARIDFNVSSHVFLDEIKVTGTKDISESVDVVPDKEMSGDGKGYLMPEDFFGVNNMLLSYNCLLESNNASGEGGRADINEYLPYIAYLDKEGNIKDTFFDSVLYLPYVSMLHDEEKSVYGRSADGWRNYVDDMFYPDRNMNALDQCADKVYSELGVTDEKIKVFTSILYTFPKLMNGSKNNFGDIDGDGIDEDFSNIEDRKKAIKWIMDEEYKRFNEGEYKHLEFCGFYWFEETIDYNDPHEKELIRFAVDYAHTFGCKVFWIPYRTAMGVNDWASLGFDAACLQPNYMFNNNGSVSSLFNTADRAENLGMCVEIEISGPEYALARKKYVEYLNVGADTGFMNAVKMYYQDGVPGAFHTCCYSKDEAIRRLYDYTYLYAKEQFKPIRSEDFVISEAPLEYTYTVNKDLLGKIDLSGIDTSFGQIVITLSPKYGSVKLNSDGSFVYYPADDYNGEDSFKVAFDVGYGNLVSAEIILKCK